MLFKALLIQQWYAMAAPECDYFLGDSIACRRFVGLRDEEVPPTHLTIAGFRLQLANRGAEAAVYAELDRQLEAAGLTDLAGQASAPTLDVNSSSRPPPHRAVLSSGPPEWTAMEATLIDYWERKRIGQRIPRLADLRLSEVSEIRQHAVLIRVIGESDDFGYEFVGPTVVNGNDGDPTGATVAEKARQNRRNYGRCGLQSELAATYAGAVSHGCLASTSASFVTAGLKRCEIWITVAPLFGANDDVEMLLCVALIKPILFN